jgi:hypothetical protein
VAVARASSGNAAAHGDQMSHQVPIPDVWRPPGRSMSSSHDRRDRLGEPDVSVPHGDDRRFAADLWQLSPVGVDIKLATPRAQTFSVSSSEPPLSHWTLYRAPSTS